MLALLYFQNLMIQASNFDLVKLLMVTDMENLNQAFTHVNHAFAQSNILFSRLNPNNPDLSSSQLIHVPDLDDVQAFLPAPMEVDHPCRLSQPGTPDPDSYKGPMTAELAREVQDAVDNGWRFDPQEHTAAPAGEQTDQTFGLTQEETIWLSTLMKAPVLEARARAVQEATSVSLKNLEITTPAFKEHDGKLLELLTTKQLHQELVGFFGSDCSNNGEDHEIGAHGEADEDELCQVKTNWTPPYKKAEVCAIEESDLDLPFALDSKQPLAGKAISEEDEMNPDGVFKHLESSESHNDESCYGGGVRKRGASAEASTPRTPHKELDICDAEPEYEPPDIFQTPSPPPYDYTCGPFMVEDITVFPKMAPEAKMTGYQYEQPEAWQTGLEQTMFSLQSSDQPVSLVTSDGDVIPNRISDADLQLEAELNASSIERGTESPGPYTRLLKSTDDDGSLTSLKVPRHGLGMQELILGERAYTGTTMKEIPAIPRSRTPSPGKNSRPTNSAAPRTPSTKTFRLQTSHPTSSHPTPNSRRRPTKQTINTKAVIRKGSPSSTTKPLTPKKSVKAVFASPKIKQGPPSPVKTDKESKDSQNHDSAGKCKARNDGLGEDGYESNTDKQPDKYSEPHGTITVHGFVHATHVSVQPDSAIDVSFPGAEQKYTATPMTPSTSAPKGTEAETALERQREQKKRAGRPRKGKRTSLESKNDADGPQLGSGSRPGSAHVEGEEGAKTSPAAATVSLAATSGSKKDSESSTARSGAHPENGIRVEIDATDRKKEKEKETEKATSPSPPKKRARRLTRSSGHGRRS